MYPFVEDYFSICVLGTAAVLVGTGMNYHILTQGIAVQCDTYAEGRAAFHYKCGFRHALFGSKKRKKSTKRE